MPRIDYFILFPVKTKVPRANFSKTAYFNISKKKFFPFASFFLKERRGPVDEKRSRAILEAIIPSEGD